jgi:Na+-translocating ferredoxin:NAD+ oxidoreductase RnfA subunit
MEWTQLFTIALGAILVNNFIVAQFLGICPFMGVSKKIETASGMGLAVIFVMGLASAICWPINELILVPMGLTFMQTVTYILVIASLVQFIEMFLKKAMPSLYEALGVYLPLITTNCAVLGVVLLVKAEMADEVAARVEDAGVFVVPKPLNRALLFGAVKLAQAANRRIMGLQRQNNILQQKIDDIRLVDRAKCALIQYRLLTEPEAHKYIEREAMDSRRTRREVAQAILRMYEGGC